MWTARPKSSGLARSLSRQPIGRQQGTYRPHDRPRSRTAGRSRAQPRSRRPAGRCWSAPVDNCARLGHNMRSGGEGRRSGRRDGVQRQGRAAAQHDRPAPVDRGRSEDRYRPWREARPRWARRPPARTGGGWRATALWSPVSFGDTMIRPAQRPEGLTRRACTPPQPVAFRGSRRAYPALASEEIRDER